MNPVQKAAYEHARKIEWDVDTAFEYAYALLVECNLRKEAEALKTANLKVEQKETGKKL